MCIVVVTGLPLRNAQFHHMAPLSKEHFCLQGLAVLRTHCASLLQSSEPQALLSSEQLCLQGLAVRTHCKRGMRGPHAADFGSGRLLTRLFQKPRR